MPAGHAQPLRDQHPDRPAARREGATSPRCTLADARPLPDGARPPRGDRRRARSPPRATPTSAPSASSEREFNLSWAERAAPRQPHRRRRASGTPDSTGSREFSVEEGIAKTLGIKLGDTLTFDVAGSTLHREGDEPAQGGLGFVQAELLRDREPAGCSQPLPGELDHELPPAAGARRRGDRAGARLSQRERDRPLGDHGAVPAHHRPGVARGASSCSCSRSPRASWCSSPRSPPRRTSASSRARSCARWARAGASSRSMQLAEFLAIGLLAGAVAAAGAVALAMVLSDRVLGVPYEFHWTLPLVGHLRRRLRRGPRRAHRHAPRGRGPRRCRPSAR